jgi:wyosine [tRNA(Phe)-imidazoG37] synthetase (radical SAM superfamily)
VFVIGAYTAIPDELAKMARCVEAIRPDRVQLNTVTWPPAEPCAVGVSRERLAELTALFHPPAEIIADFRGVHRQVEFVAGREAILQMLQRRPCSVDDIAGGLEMHRNEVVKYIGELNAENVLEQSLTANKLSYKVAGGTSR